MLRCSIHWAARGVRQATPPTLSRTLQPEQRLFSLVTTRGRWRPPYPTAKLPGHPTSEETSIPAPGQPFCDPDIHPLLRDLKSDSEPPKCDFSHFVGLGLATAKGPSSQHVPRT